MTTRPIVPQPSFVVLEPGRPVRLRLSGARMEDREITDPVSGQRKVASVLVLEISRVNGEDRQTTLSLTSYKAQSALAPLINSGVAFRREVEITRRGVGFATEYEVRVL